MGEEITSLVEEGSSNDQMPQDATPDPMEIVIKELADLRRVNQNLNDRLDSMLHPKAKKRLFNKRKRSSVDPEASEFSCILHVDGSCDKYHVHVSP